MSKINRDYGPLWQKPIQGRIAYTDDIWYNKLRVGHDPLERFLRHLSEELNLSQDDYTNCVRATLLENLDENGSEARHIIAMSGHRSESSIKKHARKCPPKKRDGNLFGRNITKTT